MAMNEPSAERQRGTESGGAGVVGALMVLLAVPLGVLTLAAGLRGAVGATGALSFFVELVRDGGGFGLGVLAATVLATIASAVMSSAALRSGVIPVPAAVLPFLFVLVVAMVGSKLQLGVITDVLPTAALEDRATILAAGISELMSLQLLSLAFCFGGLASGALACTAGLFHKDAAMRRASGVSAVGLAALAASLFSLFMSSAGLRVGFTSVGYASPSDRLVIMFAIIEELRPWSSVAAISALVVPAVAVFGGLLVGRHDRRLAIVVGVSLVVALAGFRGTLSMTDRMMSGIDVATLAEPGEDQVLVFEAAPMPYAPMVYPARLTADELAKSLAGLEQSRDGVVQLVVERHLTRDQLVEALQLARVHQLKVCLMGYAPPRPLPSNSPAMIKPFLELFNRTGTGAPLRVRFEDEACKECVGHAVVTPLGLEGPSGEVWKAKRLEQAPDDDTLQALDAEWKGTPEALARSASAALGHGSVLEVIVPRPAVSPDDSASGN
ncbi:MAG: hypothetical protein JNM17_23240 [Archangium sp.]|nr:hypothetical protein [Archangium sp.]